MGVAQLFYAIAPQVNPCSYAIAVRSDPLKFDFDVMVIVWVTLPKLSNVWSVIHNDQVEESVVVKVTCDAGMRPALVGGEPAIENV